VPLAPSPSNGYGARGLRPHKIEQFKLPTDPKFVDKLRDVVGLYVDPPAHAIVLSFEEKTQIQALDRTQPGLPMKKGRAGTMTHDDKRHSTTTLFAALNVLDGTVMGRNMQRHRQQEFIRFLNTIEALVPVTKAIHVILDTYAAHKPPKVRAWLDRHERSFHFTPTSCLWLNAVEGVFAKLSKRRLKRGVFRSVVDLKAAINRFVADHNQQPRPFAWTADPDEIIAAASRGHQVPASICADPRLHMITGFAQLASLLRDVPKTINCEPDRKAIHPHLRRALCARMAACGPC
jgi:transposase